MDPQEVRSVSVDVRTVNGQLLIKITNTYNGTVKHLDGRYHTTKDTPCHGIGLQNIKKVMAACGGYINIEHNQKTFTLMAAFPSAFDETSLETR